MKRLHVEDIMELGLNRFNSTNAHCNNNCIVSYGLVVAVKLDGQWISADGYHDYSSTTSKQVTQITSTDTRTRRKEWTILPEKAYVELVKGLPVFKPYL